MEIMFAQDFISITDIKSQTGFRLLKLQATNDKKRLKNFFKN